MTSYIDLRRIAEVEAVGGDLFQVLKPHFVQADVRPHGFPMAEVWQYGQPNGRINPIVHSLTDAYALLGTLMAIDVLNLPCLAIPMWAQYRHNEHLLPLSWFGNMPGTLIKWSTAGDAWVNDGNGGKVVVRGKSGNAQLRTMAGVYCNQRPYGTVTVIRCMPGLPYSQDKKKFSVSEAGVVHSEMNSPGVQMAYAIRHFLRLVNESGKLGRVAFKPTQAQEDGILAGLLSWMLRKTSFRVGRKFAVDGYDEHRECVDRIVALLPEDFTDAMSDWSGEIHEHISDTAYGLLLLDVVHKQEVIYLSTDLDGDRLTDLLADCSKPLRELIGSLLSHYQVNVSVDDAWASLGYSLGNGRDMTSVMFRMHGDPILEQTLGSADEMLRRMLSGKETAHGKQPYDPRIHFSLTRDAYLAANPGNAELAQWFAEVLEAYEVVYPSCGPRPPFLEGYRMLKEKVTPWGAGSSMR